MDNRSKIFQQWSASMPANMLKTEADLRHAVMDRLIAASLSDGKPAREATVERWRALGKKPVPLKKNDLKST
jgi:hypothetical protein